MKKFCLTAVFALCIVGMLPLFGQDQNERRAGIDPKHASDYYYFDIPIQKVYPYRLGYVVVYQTAPHRFATTYIPINWFDEKKPGENYKGELIWLAPGSEAPHFTAFYKNKKFAYVRLCLRRDIHDLTYGNIPTGVNLDDKFKPNDPPNIVFGFGEDIKQQAEDTQQGTSGQKADQKQK
jgi:hypothetical protein